MQLPAIITPDLLQYIRKSYRLSWDGIHGWSHWMRVLENGLRVAEASGANTTVVTLFAFTHDMARENDWGDREHGPRAAERIVSELQGTAFDLPENDLEMLVRAVRLHTFGLLEDEITVQTCWDADRLDLGRAGIRPHPTRLCTAAARDPEVIAWAYRRSTT